MKARIYRPAKTAMQSGRAKTHDWVLEFEPSSAQRLDPLMAGREPAIRRPVRLRFASEQEALDYARRRGLDVAVETPAKPVLKPKSYADNFRYDRQR